MQEYPMPQPADELDDFELSFEEFYEELSGGAVVEQPSKPKPQSKEDSEVAPSLNEEQISLLTEDINHPLENPASPPDPSDKPEK
jgi:hypothetical protein